MQSLKIAGATVHISTPVSQETAASTLTVLLHGYGAGGTDLVPLGRELQQRGAVGTVACVEAPLLVDPIGGGRAWWPIDVEALMLAGAAERHDEIEAHQPAGITEIRESLAQVVTLLLASEETRLVLGGFSQGAMMALELALFAEALRERLDGLLLFSGMCVAPRRYEGRLSSLKDVPAIVTHGVDDVVIPFALGERLRDRLTDAGSRVRFVAFQGGHGIPPEALEPAVGLGRSEGWGRSGADGGVS